MLPAEKSYEKVLAISFPVRYNSSRCRSFAGVAQLVERVIGNDEVHGSDSHHQLHKEPLNGGSFLYFFI